MPVFLLSRASERGNLHSTGISRFLAIPVPVPLQSRLWNASFHVGRSYSGMFTQELLCTPGLLHDRCPARCRLRPRGLARHSPLTCSCAWPARGSMRSAVSQTVAFSGLCVGFRAPPFTSLDAHCQGSGSGWLDQPCPGWPLICYFL